MRTLICTLFYFFALYLRAQEPVSINYSIENGLLSNEAHFVFNDSKGYIWIATDAGISRFDGYEFKSFSIGEGLPETVVLKLYEDQKGRIWFITLSSYVGYIQNEKIHLINFQFREPMEKGKENFAYSIFVDSGDTLWVSTIYSGLLFKMKPGYRSSPKKIKMDADFVMKMSDKGELIYGTCSKDKQKSIEFNYLIKGKSKTIKNKVESSTRFEKRKRLILLNENEFIFDNIKSLMHFKNGILREVRHFDAPITFIHSDANGSFWVGAHGEGVYKLNPSNNYSIIDHFLTDQTVTWVSSDFEGGTWFTTLTGGVFYIPDFSFEKLISNKKIERIKTLEDGSIYANEQNGSVFKLNNGKISDTYSLKALDFLLHDRKIYFTSLQTEPNLFLPNTKKYIPFDLMENGEIPRFKRFIRTNGKLYGCHTYYLFENLNAPQKFKLVMEIPERINDFTVDQHGIYWIASGSGLISYDPKKDKLFEYRNIHTDLGNRFDQIEMDEQGRLWLGTKGKGVYLFEPTKKNKKPKNIQVPSSGIVRDLYIDNNSGVWVLMNDGLFLINSSGIQNYSFILKYKIGLLNSVLLTKEQLYLGTSMGLFRIKLETLEKRKYKNYIPTYITLASSSRDISLKGGSRLEYKENSIKINYLSLSYLPDDPIVYHYKIEGLHNEWRKTGNTFVEILNLPPGDYTFSVLPEIGGHKFTNSIARFSFSVAKPFWMTWWFIVLCVTLFLGLLFFVTRIRTNRKLKKENEKMEMKMAIANLESKALRAQMNPHFVFNSLNSIQSYILQNDTVTANKFLSKFAILIREILENSKAEKISLENEIDMLDNYLELEKMRANNSFDFSIVINAKLENGNIQIPIMLLQPIVENAVIHGVLPLTDRKGLIEIEFSKGSDNTVMISIRDNGIGRAASEKLNEKKKRYHSSMGISISKERVQKTVSPSSNSQFEVTDLFDENSNPIGTEIKLTISQTYDNSSDR